MTIPIHHAVAALFGLTLAALWLTLPAWTGRPPAGGFSPGIVSSIALGAAVSAAIATAGTLGLIQDAKALAVDPSPPPLQEDFAEVPVAEAKTVVIAPKSNIPRVVFAGPPNRRAIALVFDDGPHPRHTEALLAILHQYKAKATFAALGRNVDRHPDIVRRVLAAGHQVVSHGYTHTSFTKLSKAELSAELDKTAVALKRAGVDPVQWVRPPYGATSKAVNELIATHGARVLMWSIDPEDWRPGKTPDQTAAEIILGARPGSIVVAHDTKPNTVEATRITLHALSNRFEFVTIDNLMGLKAPPAPPIVAAD